MVADPGFQTCLQIASRGFCTRRDVASYPFALTRCQIIVCQWTLWLLLLKRVMCPHFGQHCDKTVNLEGTCTKIWMFQLIDFGLGTSSKDTAIPLTTET